ncbi:BAI1-associated protein 3-like isoform X3 [Scylla paramamosain]
MEEQQLSDVFYSALHLHSTPDPLLQQAARRASAAVIETGLEGAATQDTPTMDELQKELKDLFEVDEATMVQIKEQAQKKDSPHITLHVSVHEATDLKPKTPRETSHPYCIVRVSGSNETFKTRVLTDTLAPVWESQFSMWIPARQDAKIAVEVWHDPQEGGVEHFSVRDIRELSRLVRGATSKEMRNLLGSVILPLADMKEQSTEGWYHLSKSREEECNQMSSRESFKANKKRGSVRLTLRVATVAQLNLIGPHWFENFLSRVIQHRLGYLSTFSNFRRGRTRTERTFRSLRSTSKSTKNNSNVLKSSRSCIVSNNSVSDGSNIDSEGMVSFSPPWKGTLSSTKVCLLEHYAITLNLTPPIIAFSWWKVCSRLVAVEQAFLGSLLKTLQGYLSEGRYSQAETEDIESSLRQWVETETDKLRNLTTHFPAYSKIVSYAQLQGIIRNFNAVMNDCNMKEMNIFPSSSSINQLISDSLMEFSRIWWESCLKSKGRNSHTATEDQQLMFAVSVAGEVYTFLAEVCNFYHDVFYREASISFLKLTYTLLTTELGARVRTLLHQIYSSSVKKKLARASGHCEADRYSLEPGTPVWQLYKKFEIIEKIGENLPSEVQQQSGLQSYQQWFLGGIERWMERVFARTKALITKDIEKDDLGMNSTGVSPSAVETKSNFKIIKSSWQKLSWPEEVEVDRVMNPLLHNLCGLGTHFVRLMITKLESRHEEDTSRDLSFLSPQSCSGLNNIQYLRKEIEAVPEFFDLTHSDKGGNNFSVVTKTSSKMEESVSLFMDNAVAKVRPTLSRAVEASCDMGSEYHLVHDVLDKEFCVLRQRLDDTNFKSFILKIWNALIVIFTETVEKNATSHSAEYFKGVFIVLERCWFFFTPIDHTGLEPQCACTSEYLSLKKTLSNLKLPTEALIAKYYQERHEELLQTHSCTAELVVRAFFMRSGKLVIEVIMARNIVGTSRKLPDTQVTVKLVPNEWFQSGLIAKTKIHRKTDTPVFDEKFEVVVCPTDGGLKTGYLHFLLKSHYLLQSHVIGEAVLPLDKVPSLDFPEASDVKNQFLNMNVAKNSDDYAAAKALKFRTWDRRAQLFLQRTSLRN